MSVEMKTKEEMNLADATLPEYQEMVQLALEAERTEAALKQMKDRLKKHVDEHGPLYAGDKVWDYSNSTSWKFEPAKLKEMAQAIVIEGKNPWDFLTLPAASITKLGWTSDALGHFGEMKSTKRFDSKKA